VSFSCINVTKLILRKSIFGTFIGDVGGGTMAAERMDSVAGVIMEAIGTSLEIVVVSFLHLNAQYDLTYHAVEATASRRGYFHHRTRFRTDQRFWRAPYVESSWTKVGVLAMLKVCDTDQKT
jgi:hypothetical protein